MVEYHEKPGIPGSFFSCPYGMGVMSTTFCADSHKKSTSKEYIKEHKRTTCRFCPVGGVHSGARDTATGSRLYGSLLCSRCERVSNRLVAGRICVSCYNRIAENRTGLNAKGNPLKLRRHYYPVTLLLVKERMVSLRKVDGVMNASEAVLSVLLNSGDNVMFGWSGNGVMINYAE